MNEEKPPMGITPENVWKRQRFAALAQAIERRAMGEHPPADEWINELTRLRFQIWPEERKFKATFAEKRGDIPFDQMERQIEDALEKQAERARSGGLEEDAQPTTVPKLYPFDPDRALAGGRVVTRDGREAAEFRRWPADDQGDYPYRAKVSGVSYSFSEKGEVVIGDTRELDLFMAEPAEPKPEPDADGWIPHTPGDPMPCEENLSIRIKRSDGATFSRTKACDAYWGRYSNPRHDIIAWKPA